MNHGPPKPPALPAWLSPMAVSVLVNQKPWPFATRTGSVLIVHRVTKHVATVGMQDPTYLWDEAEESWVRADLAPKSLRKSLRGER